MVPPPLPSTLNVCAVIVAHNADETLAANTLALLNQLNHIYLIDNGSDAHHAEKLRSLSRKDPRITLLYCKENNLSKAQNMGISAARKDNYAWVLLLDDDSQANDDMLIQMKQAYEAQDSKTSIGLIAPKMIDQNTQRTTHYIMPHYKVGFKKREAAGDAFTGCLFVIASGSLIPMSTFDHIGMMDESFVIDYIDKEFCLRLNQMGLLILVAPSAVLHHTIGQCQDHTLLGKTVTTTNHPASRRHTIYRNRLRTITRYAFSIPSFVTHDILAIGYDLMRIILFEADKSEKLRAIASGVCDAILGRNETTHIK